MGRFDEIINDVLNELIHKGYDDKTIHSFGGLAQFRRDMILNLSAAVVSDKLVPYFPMFLLGFDGQTGDAIHFEFDFLFDRKSKSLELHHMTASLLDHKLAFTLGKDMADIPASMEIYKVLTEQLQADQILSHRYGQDGFSPTLSLDRKGKIDELIFHHRDILIGKEYLQAGESGHQQTLLFSQQLRRKIYTAESHQPHDQGHFALALPLNNNYQVHPMTVRMAFEYDPRLLELHLFALKGYVRDQQMMLKRKAVENLPKARKLYIRLNERQTIQDAKKMLDSPPSKRHTSALKVKP